MITNSVVGLPGEVVYGPVVDARGVMRAVVLEGGTPVGYWFGAGVWTAYPTAIADPIVAWALRERAVAAAERALRLAREDADAPGGHDRLDAAEAALRDFGVEP